jgi:hypothetical protein
MKYVAASQPCYPAPETRIAGKCLRNCVQGDRLKELAVRMDFRRRSRLAHLIVQGSVNRYMIHSRLN